MRFFPGWEHLHRDNMKNDLRRYTNEVLKASGIRAKKKYGQNFLTDESILDGIVEAAGVAGEDAILEIGPGTGNLTERLCEAADRVLAVEIDPDMASILSRRLSDLKNLSVWQQDILEADTKEIASFAGDSHLKVVANLPYYITTPILMHLMESDLWQFISGITVMVQKEVADRLSASSGGKDYGAVTVAVQYRCEVRTAITVPPEAFIPPPGVDSAVVVLTRRQTPIADLDEAAEKRFFALVKAAFAMRRKTLVNALSHAGYASWDKGVIEESLLQMGLDPMVRGEVLSIEQFIALSEKLA